MKKHGLQLAALVLAVVLGHAMAVSSIPGKDKKTAAKPAKALTYEQDSVFGERFLKAVQLREKGKFDSSMMYIDSCLQINPNSAVAHFMRAEYNASNDKDTLALQDYEAAATLEPDNDTYQERVAQMYIGTGNFAKATEAYEKLYKGHRDRDDVLNILVQLYRQQKDYDKMLDAINRLEQVDGESDQLSMMRMNAYELKGDEKGAYATLKGLADSHPNDPNFKLMLGNWLMQHKRQQEGL